MVHPAVFNGRVSTVLKTKVPLGHQLAQRLARAWRFSALQILRQARFVAQLAHRNGGMQRITLWNLQLLARQLLIVNSALKATARPLD